MKAGRPRPVPEEIGRSASKRRAAIDAATEGVPQGCYLGTNMDEIATLSGVSKQTVYKHFASKEALFVEIVGSMTSDAGDRVHNDAPDLPPDDDLAAYLEDYAYLQLSIVLTPQVMRAMRRLVIGEVGRFPENGQGALRARPAAGDRHPGRDVRAAGGARSAARRRCPGSRPRISTGW